jgi:FkbM family methyltransferase
MRNSSPETVKEMSDLNKLILTVGRLVPLSLRQKVIGDGYRPSWVSTTIHSMLNHLSSEKYPVIPCGGALKGYRMRVEWARYRCFAYGSWEPELIQLVSKTVKPGFTIVDVGAHIGYYSLLFSRLVGPTGRVIAFEPVPKNFEFLNENVKLNHCTNIEPENRAVLDRSQQIRIEVPDDDPLPVGVSFANPDNKGDVIVTAVSLDEFALGRTKRVDFLKVDAEGAEDKVLDGARGLIERDHPLIMMEVHHFDGCLEKSAIPARLVTLGYRLEQIDRGYLTSHFWATWPDAK